MVPPDHDANLYEMHCMNHWVKLQNRVKSYTLIYQLWFSFLFLKFQCPAAAAAKSLQLCPTLCNPIDSSPPGSPVPGILQARTLEWVAISSSNAWKWKVKVKSFSRVRLPATPWTAAHQAPPSMGFSRQEYWSGVPLPSPFSVLVAFKIIQVLLLHPMDEKTRSF